MRTLDITELHGFVVGLELMAAIINRDDEITILCRSTEQASLVAGAIDRAKSKGKTNVTSTVKVKKEVQNAFNEHI